MEGPIIAIFCGEVFDKEKIKAYQSAAIPLAEQAGLELLGSAEPPIVWEGNWPFDGFVVTERFSSLTAFKDYQNSQEYLLVKRLRDEAANMHAVILLADNTAS